MLIKQVTCPLIHTLQVSNFYKMVEMETKYKVERRTRATITRTTNKTMGSTSFLLTLLHLFMVTTSILPPTASSLGDEHRLRWVPMRATGCQGSIEECIAEGEFGMQPESHRRILATSQYISYKALQRNTVPCSRRGASYYNCHPGAEANPYTRGCTSITRCRAT